jgi:hypothetical protein
LLIHFDMTSTSPILRTLLIYSICLPVAIFLGYIIASPYDPTRDITTYLGVGLVLFFLSIPLLLKWHRIWMVAAWNSCTMLYFLPGRPELWFALIWLSLLISVLQYILNRRQPFISVTSITRPLIFLAVVVLVTAKLTGGMGLGALGSDTLGGKKYILLLSAIAGYFALTSQRIPPNKALLFVTLFFLGYLTDAIGDLGPLVPPGFYFIFWLFPISGQSVSTMFGSPGQGDQLARFGGLAMAGSGIFSAMLARYGIRQLFNAHHLFRLALFLFAASFALLGGFRSTLIQFALVFCVVFYLEGLMRSKLLPAFLLAGALSLALMLAFTSHLPLSVQRTLTILPIQVDESARRSAEDTSKWRLDMWKAVIPTIPQYLLLGKGFLMTSAEMNSFSSGKPGEMQQFEAEGSAAAGDFHNGPLSLLIPFGIWGFGGFIWLLVASWKVLHRNYLYGDPVFQTINRFLFGLFVSRAIFFFAIFGSFYSDLAFFTGLLGLSVSINGGVSRPYLIPQQKRPAPSSEKPTTARGRPIGPAVFEA